MSNSTYLITVDCVVNLVSACFDAIALLICFTFLSIIAYRLLRTRYLHGHEPITVPLILSINIFCVIIAKCILQIVHVTLPTIRRDFQMHDEVHETFGCRFRAYVLWGATGLSYWSYVLLAFFRFVRVIYPRQVWLHRPSLYLFVLIPGHVIIEFVSLLPILLAFDALHLIPSEAYCNIVVQPIYYSTYQSTISYTIPYVMLCIFYSLIRRHTRLTTVRAFRERNQRDYFVTRRMLLNTFVLYVVTVPCFIMYIIAIVQNRFDLIVYRVQWLSSSICSCLFALLVPLTTTQVLEFLKVNRVAPAIHHT